MPAPYVLAIGYVVSLRACGSHGNGADPIRHAKWQALVHSCVPADPTPHLLGCIDVVCEMGELNCNVWNLDL